jgi:hypothetical protein
MNNNLLANQANESPHPSFHHRRKLDTLHLPDMRNDVLGNITGNVPSSTT